VPLLRWSATTMRRIIAARDRIMFRAGTDEPWIEEPGNIALHWRKPLRIDEVARLAQTPEVRARPGRA